jgi:hypothetical protein
MGALLWPMLGTLAVVLGLWFGLLLLASNRDRWPPR